LAVIVRFATRWQMPAQYNHGVALATGEESMVTRRKLVFALGAGMLAAPFTALAQPRQVVYRVGFLAAGSQTATANLYQAFRNSLRDLGYIAGQNIAFEARYADGRLDRLPALAAELGKLKLDIVFAPTSPAVRAVRQVTDTLPIVFAVVNDPVERGLVQSAARPGGNTTGVMNSGAGLAGKRLQLLKEAFPGVGHIAVAFSRDPGATNDVVTQIKDMQQAAAGNGMETMPIEIRSRNSFEDASEILAKWRANGMSCLDSSVNWSNRDVLIEFAARMQLPAIYPSRDYTEAGGLMSYGADATWNYRRAATLVDKILKGAKAGELAVESPGKFELVINKKVAGALKTPLSSAFLKKADRVIL
jgi:putative tryptophan/tyrosine transport system substrate-binding protein